MTDVARIARHANDDPSQFQRSDVLGTSIAEARRDAEVTIMLFARSFFFTVAVLGAAIATIHCGGTSDDGVPAPSTNTSPADPAKEAGQDASSSSPDKDAATPPPDASTDSTTKPNACNTLVNDATAITYVEIVASTAPTPTGGAMVDGTYHLTSITLYSPNGKATKIPVSLKNTVNVHGNVVDQVFDGTKTGPSGKTETIAERSTETFTTSGSTVTYTMTCPEAKSRTGAYSVKGSTMTLFLKNDLGQDVLYTYAP
jgi:hypothetical protein